MTTAETIAESGYLRFPNAWLRLPLSPGAKCLLVHFCGAADETGTSWYSFSQLGDILGRSRASISAYVAELREAGLIVTEHQKTANGFNYRLRIRLREWTDIIDAWRERRALKAAPSNPKIERRVQKTEHKNPKGSKPESNKHTLSQASKPTRKLTDATSSTSRPVFPKELENQWTDCFTHPGDAVPAKAPSVELLEAVLAHADALRRHYAALTPERARTAAAEAIDAFVRNRRLDPPSSAERERLSTVIAKHVRTSHGLNAIVAALRTDWKRHWRRLSTPAQLEGWIKERQSEGKIPLDDLSDLWRFENRALRARAELAARRSVAHS